MTEARLLTVLELLRRARDYFAEKGVETPRLDAECLLAHALGVDRLRLYVDFEKPVEEPEVARFRELVRRRAGGREPVAQILGRREFWSLPVGVTPAVLVPRPETETLVEVALELAPDRDAELRALDVGTGSGAVALALAHERPKARITATDVSPAALEVARANADALGRLDRLRFAEGDLFAPLAGERFDLVVSNPPYLADGARVPPELEHEPRVALFAGPEGTEVLSRLAREVPGVLEAGGAAAFEVDPGQAEAVAGLLREAGLERVTVHRDLARRPRVVSGRRPPGVS